MFGFVCQANENYMLYDWHDWLVFLKVEFNLTTIEIIIVVIIIIIMIIGVVISIVLKLLW